MLGLLGSHRTGKTTLARAFAEEFGVQFIESPVSSIFFELGLDPSEDFPFDDRIRVQEAILSRLSALYEGRESSLFIADRSPLDFLAYTLAEVQKETLTPEQTDWMLDYIERCFAVTNMHFGGIIVVQPGIKYVDADGKGGSNRAYIEHINTLALGFVSDPRLKARKMLIRRDVTDLRCRLDIVRKVYEGMLKGLASERAVSEVH